MPSISATSIKAGRSGMTLVATTVCGAATLVFGLWSLLAPRGFAAFIAFPPYNEHLLHDVGAFQIGLRTGLLLALVCSDAAAVTLAGFAVAGVIHTANHVLDHHLGGHLGDPWGLGALTLIALLGLISHRRRNATPPASDQHVHRPTR